MLYNHTSAGDEFFTPKFIFDALSIEFDLDVSSPVDLITNVPAKHRFTSEQDGLAQKWFGNVWMNPPYSNPTPWVDKFIEHAQGIALLPFTKGKWWFKMWNTCSAILPIAHDLKFEKPDGTFKPITFNVALYAMGADNVRSLRKVAWHAVK
jgi:hypothetical protein